MLTCDAGQGEKDCAQGSKGRETRGGVGARGRDSSFWMGAKVWMLESKSFAAMIRFRSNSRLGFTASQRVTQQGASAHQAAAHDSRPNRRAAKPIEKQAGDNGSDRVADAGHEQGFDADAFRAQARDLDFVRNACAVKVADHNVHGKCMRGAGADGQMEG